MKPERIEHLRLLANARYAQGCYSDRAEVEEEYYEVAAEALPECLDEIERLQNELEAFKPTVCGHDDPSWCDYKCFQGQLAVFRKRAQMAEAQLCKDVDETQKTSSSEDYRAGYIAGLKRGRSEGAARFSKQL
jgi:hypothetical protein